MTFPYYQRQYRPGALSWRTENHITLDNFAGGMNNVDNDGVIADNESPDCKNMRFISGNLMEKRPGIVFSTTPHLSALDGPIVWLDEYKTTDGQVHLVRATANSVYIDDTFLCSVNGPIRGVNYIGKYYFVDGHNIYVYDGINYYALTVPYWHLESNAASGATQLHLYSKPGAPHIPVFANIYIQGPTSSFWTSVTSHTADEEYGHWTVELATPLPFDVYMGTNLVFSYVPLGEGYYTGTTQYWDSAHVAYYCPCEYELSYAYAGAPFIPTSPDVITVHLDRLFISGDTEQPHGVYMSQTGQPLYFPSGAGVGVTPDGEKVVDLIVFDGALIIGRHKDLFVLYGSSEYADQTSDPFYIKRMDASIGLMCANCGGLLNNYYIYLGYDGLFYKLNTPTTFVEYLMTRPCDRKIDLTKEPFGIAATGEGSVSKMSTVVHFNEIYFNIHNNLVVVYNYDNMAWTYFTGWYGYSLFIKDSLIYIGRGNGTLAYYNDSDVININYNDCGNSFEAYWKSKRFDFGNSAYYKYFKMFMLSAKCFDGFNSRISVKAAADDNVEFSTELAEIGLEPVVSPGISGSVQLADDTGQSDWIKLDARGRTIQFTFSNSRIGEPMLVYDLNLIYSSRDLR